MVWMMSIRSCLAIAIALISAFVSGFCVRAHYLHKIDELKIAHAKAIAKAKDENIKGLEDATNSIILADSRYSALLGEHNLLLDKLRKSASANNQSDSISACRKRNADLGRMVSELSELAEKCNYGWHECSKRKDALIEVIK